MFTSTALWGLFFNFVLPPVAIVLVPILGTLFYNWALTHISNEKLKSVFVKASVAVAAVEQEYVKGIKAGSADGNLTADEEKAARQLAVKKTIEMVGSGLSESVAGTVIESVINASKDPKSAVGAKVGL